MLTTVVLAIYLFSSILPLNAHLNILNTTQFLDKYGYKWENHDITTEDGYILTFQRIPSKTNGKAVLFLHGLLGDSVYYINEGPGKSLGLILADKGYDVWLGNSRGTAWCRKHKTLSPTKDPKEFFDFSWHELGYYDLAAAVDYILPLLNQSNLYYIGHSQGTSDFVVLTSTRPEYNSKFRLGILLAPAPLRSKLGNEYLNLLSRNIYFIEYLMDALRIYEVPFIDLFREIVYIFCAHVPLIQNTICKEGYLSFGKSTTPRDNKNVLWVALSSDPSNAASRQLYHYGQEVKNHRFAWYDYGERKNLEKYGTKLPPLYNVTAITAPVALYVGNTDAFSFIKDVDKLANALQHVARHFVIPTEKFNHMDYIYHKDAVQLLYNDVLDTMDKF